MTLFFQNVLTASFHGSIVILAVMVLRLVLKRTPRKFFCFLWLLAGIRLLMPFEIQSVLSLQPDVETITEARFSQTAPTVPPAEALPVYVPEEPVVIQQPEAGYMPVMPEQWPIPEAPVPPMEEPEYQTDPLMTLDAIAANIWLAVAFCFVLHTFASYLRLKLQVREAIRLKGNIWECDRIETAFILGFIRPRIYLPMGMSKNTRRHILAHEQTHLEKGDHWFKMIGYIALAIHWFNPLVWVAYILLCKDIEIACDERVVQFMELEERKSYSAALINCSTNHAHFAACPVAFGEVSVKNRVISVLKYKKPSFWISLAGVIAILFVAVCLVTSPTEKAEVIPETTEETLPPREVVEVSTVEELLAAIGPDREILLEAGTYNLSEASSYGNAVGSDYYKWGQVSDGYELVLTNVENLAIRGSGMHVTLIETDPRFADVLAMENCRGLEVEAITLGHTRLRGECGGGVISLRQSSDIGLHQLGLYGCGMVGLETETAAHVTLTDSDIYDCSNSAASLGESQDITISGCRIYRIGDEQYGGYTYFNIWHSRDVIIDNNEISDSEVSALLSAYTSQVTLKNNRISGNRFTGGVLEIQRDDGTEVDVVLDGNKFVDNSIRKWYQYSLPYCARDGKGRDLTEEVLTKEYGTDLQPQAQQPQLQIHVSTVDEFIAAIGPDKEIILDAGLYDLSTATGYGTSRGDYYYWEDIFDGPGLVIQNVNNMTIRSNDGDVTKHTISAVPRYADVLGFRACSNITVSGFTAGHTKEPGSCAGGVLEFRDSDFITVENCGLFGCGILGVETQSCSNVTVKDCEIYECSNGGIEMRDTYNVNLDNNTFRDIGGRYIMYFNSCMNVTIDGTEQFVRDVLASAGISTPEQEDLHALEYIVMDFPYEYRVSDAAAIAEYLSDSYTGEVTVMDWGDRWVENYLMDITPDQLKQIQEQGSMEYTVPFTEWVGAEVRDVGVLTFTVIKENGVFKVSDYTFTPVQP